MPRAQWGGGGDPSSVFAGMANQFENKLEGQAQDAINRAKADSEAKAAEVYNQWKNGEISDDEWLNFLREKVAGSTDDPTEHQRWSDALRDHEGAILDAQMEANYSMGKLSLAGLMAHYSRQMQGVETNSPKWRDYAARYAQIQGAVRGSGGSGGSGGGGGGAIKAALGTLNQHPSGFAFDPNGEDIINPANNVIGYADGEDFLNNLFSDTRRIDLLMGQLKADPSLTVLQDPYTEWSIPVTPDMLTEIDRQYLRTEDQIVAYNEALGTTAGFESAQKARQAKQTYINGPMMQHNADRVQPVYDAMVQVTAERVASAGKNPDPAARLAVYRDIAKQWSSFEDGTLDGMGGRGLQQAVTGSMNPKAITEGDPSRVHWTTMLPDELQVSGALFKQSEAWKNFFGEMTNPTLDPIQRNLLIDEFVGAVSGSEGQIAKSDVLKMIEGDTGETSGVPITGILETHDQYLGVAYADDPNYAGSRFVYVNDKDGTHLVEAEMRDVPHDGGHVTQELVPAGVETGNLVRTITKIGGRVTTVWTEPTPVNDPRFMAYRATADFTVAGKLFKKGTYIPSEWIASNGGQRGINALVSSGQVDRESQVLAIDTPNGRWFIDPETRLASRSVPILSDHDPTTGGINVDGDGQVNLHYGTSAGSVFMAYSGMDAKEAQAYVSNQIRTGGIVPTDWGYRNVGGEVSSGPVNGQWDDASADSLYWSKNDELVANPGHVGRLDSWGAGHASEARRREQANTDFVRSAVSDNASPSFGDILRDPLAAVRQFAKQAGIQVDNPFTPTDGTHEAAPPKGRLDFLPADDAVFGVRQRRAEMLTQKRGMIAPAPPADAFAPPATRQADLPVPPPPVAAIAAGRTYTAIREGTPPAPMVAKPKVTQKNDRFKGSM